MTMNIKIPVVYLIFVILKINILTLFHDKYVFSRSFSIIEYNNPMIYLVICLLLVSSVIPCQ